MGQKTKLLSYSAIVSALLVFGFYSSTMNYADAFQFNLVTFTGPDIGGQDPDGIRGVTYREGDNRWYMTAPNNTIITMNQAFTQGASYLTTASSMGCTQPNHIIALKDFNYLATTCDEGTGFWSISGTTLTVLNETSDFQFGNYVNMVEWQNGDTMILQYYSETLGRINLDCVGATCVPSQAFGTISLATNCGADNTIMDIEIDQIRDNLWIVCTNEVVVYDLSLNLVIAETVVAAQISSITYNPVADKMVVTGYTVGTSDIYVIDANDFALENTVVHNRECDMSASHTLIDTVYIGCSENDTVYLFDISSLAVIASVSVANIDATPLNIGTTDIIPQMTFTDETETMCMAHNGPDSVVATENYVSCITDVSGLAGGEQPSDFCSIAGNENLLRCKLEEQGGALGGNFANNPFDISNSTSNILIQVGFLDSSDTNPATNGTGYLILAIALIIANVLLWIGTSGGAFTTSNLFLPALISLVIITGFTVGGLVDATVLILAIIAMIALSAPKLVSIIGGARGGGDSS